MHIYIFFPQNVIQIRPHYFLDEVFLGTRSVMRQSFVPSPNVHIFHPRNTVPYRSIKPKYATQSGKLSKYLPLNVFLFPPPWNGEVHLGFSCRSVNSSEIFKALGIRVFVTYFQIVFFFLKWTTIVCISLCDIIDQWCKIYWNVANRFLFCFYSCQIKSFQNEKWPLPFNWPNYLLYPSFPGASLREST